MAWAGTTTFIDNFDRAQVLTTTPGQNGWTIADTSSAGSPTYLCATEDGGKMVLTLANDTEAENVCMYHNDVLMFDAARIKNFWYVAKVASISANTTLLLGMGSARNDAGDSVTNSAWFRMEGSTSTSALVVETDDNTNNNDDKATGTTLAAVYKRLYVDFSQGLSDVRFYVDGARVASSTTFDMSDISSGSNLQPIVQIQKASSAGTPAVHIAQFGITYTWSYGA